ncbi:hypothetical protein T265_06728 [Opisthorchis viverrini]|uniref:Uncharacterized protein n=1 Tax=Opisthorchis viverrini TaxID=6198 RepID=A0A075AD94_OPIVI|nr:hypothetical protein T265_06728 [Opisthorchis viverrini]KER25924.1 hypothetical protein T265_06728 [Opisthorchis viverrini]
MVQQQGWRHPVGHVELKPIPTAEASWPLNVVHMARVTKTRSSRGHKNPKLMVMVILISRRRLLVWLTAPNSEINKQTNKEKQLHNRLTVIRDQEYLKRHVTEYGETDHRQKELREADGRIAEKR